MQVGGWQGFGGVRQTGRQAGGRAVGGRREGAVSGSEGKVIVGAVVVVVLGVMWDGSREWSVAAVMDDGWLEGRSVGRKLGVPSFLPCFAASSHCCAAAAREIQNAE